MINNRFYIVLSWRTFLIELVKNYGVEKFLKMIQKNVDNCISSSIREK